MTQFFLDEIPIDSIEVLNTTKSHEFHLRTKQTGVIKITEQANTKLLYEGEEKKAIIAGILRNFSEIGQESPKINISFIEEGFKSYDFPKTFKEKITHLLKFLYNHGGSENKKFEFYPFEDYPIAYALNHDEFSRIIYKLKNLNFINFQNEKVNIKGDVRWFKGILMTELGIKEIEKQKFGMYLAPLTEETIVTGDKRIDAQVIHAKTLFFKEDSTFEDKRNACETLSFIIEPLREKLKNVLTDKDTNALFTIINDFDIRHNKGYTKRISDEIWLEWVYYSLLNTIRTYFFIINKNKS